MEMCIKKGAVCLLVVCLLMALFIVSIAAAQPSLLGAKEKRALAQQNAAEAGAEGGAEKKADFEASSAGISSVGIVSPRNPRNLAVRERYQIAKERYLEAKERYQAAKKGYAAARHSFREAKEKSASCGEDAAETAECSQIKEQARERAKELLLKTAGRILEHLNKVKASAESNTELSEEESGEIIGKIDGMIAEITDAKSSIESAENKDEIKEAAKTIKEAWLRIKKRLVVHTGRIVNARIGGVIVKTERLEAKLGKIVERMQEQGMNTSEVELLIFQFRRKIEGAKNSSMEALEKFKEAALVSSEDGTERMHELAVEGHKLMKAAHKSLQEAQKLLRDIVLSVKQAGGEEELNAVEETKGSQSDVLIE